jgi:hypothetical protein
VQLFLKPVLCFAFAYLLSWPLLRTKKALNMVQSECLFMSVPVCTYLYSNARRMIIGVAVELFKFGRPGTVNSQLLFRFIFSVVFLSSSKKMAG